MKIKAAVIFFLLLGKAFSQDTTAVDSVGSSAAAVDSSISRGLHFFAGFGAQFINFKSQAEFQKLLEARFTEYKGDYSEDSAGYLEPKKQDFQSINLAFPINIGVMWQFSDTHSLGIGAGFLYDNESVILTDKHGETHNLKYTLQAFPIFAEYRLRISPNLMSLSNGDYFSLFFRYYWMLPGTEIYSTWGQAKADFEPLGNGYGIFMGYRFLDWQKISLWGELGFLSLDIKSSDKDAVLDSWNLGGISILIRITI